MINQADFGGLLFGGDRSKTWLLDVGYVLLDAVDVVDSRAIGSVDLDFLVGMSAKLVL